MQKPYSLLFDRKNRLRTEEDLIAYSAENECVARFEQIPVRCSVIEWKPYKEDPSDENDGPDGFRFSPTQKNEHL